MEMRLGERVRARGERVALSVDASSPGRRFTVPRFLFQAIRKPPYFCVILLSRNGPATTDGEGIKRSGASDGERKRETFAPLF